MNVLLVAFVAVSVLSEGSLLESLLSNTFINNLCHVINQSVLVLLLALKSREYSDFYSSILTVHVSGISIILLRLISVELLLFLLRDYEHANCQYTLGNVLVLRNDCIKDVSLHIEYKLHCY